GRPVRAQPVADGDRGGQRALHHADREHPIAAPRRRVGARNRVRRAPGQQHVHALDPGRPVRRAAHPGHDRGEPRLRVGALPGPALLFCPGDRPDRYEKARAAADAVILDLEDAVAPAGKDAARAAVAASALPAETTIVRINPVDAGMLEADLAAVEAAGYGTVMPGKPES